MKSQRWSWLLVVGVVCAFSAASLAQTKEAKRPAGKPGTEGKMPGGEDMAKMMEAWQKAATPGEAHDKLKPLAGKWTYVTKARMTPDEPFHESTGKAEFKWELGGRYLFHEVKGNPSEHDAMMGGPFEGAGMYGYDNLGKQYFFFWADSMSTAPMMSHGTADGSGKTFTFMADEPYECPMTGEKKAPKSVLKIVGDDKVVFEMYDKGPDGKEFMGLEVTYTRQK